MKKYFVIYQKEENDIIDGCWYYNPYLKISHRHQIQSKGIGGPILGSYRVKRLLCEVVEGIDIFTGKDVYILFNNPDNIPPFKVIGEISREAMWIKDRDKFDVDEIQFQISMQPPFEGWKEVSFDEYKEWNELKKIMLKGPCGHFH